MSHSSELSPEGRKAYQQLRAARSNIDYYRQLADEARAVIETELGDRYDEATIGGVPVVTYKQIKSNRLDTAALKKALPDVVAHYTTVTESRRFNVIEGVEL